MNLVRCSLLFRVIVYKTNNFHVVLCPPLPAPHPGDATVPNFVITVVLPIINVVTSAKEDM